MWAVTGIRFPRTGHTSLSSKMSCPGCLGQLCVSQLHFHMAMVSCPVFEILSLLKLRVRWKFSSTVMCYTELTCPGLTLILGPNNRRVTASFTENNSTSSTLDQSYIKCAAVTSDFTSSSRCCQALQKGP